MQGMRFLLLSENGKPVNHGIIIQQINPENYLCQFARSPAICRVCELEEMRSWNLFPTEEALNSFIAALAEKPADPPADPPVTKKVAKKAGKTTRKKANAKK